MIKGLVTNCGEEELQLGNNARECIVGVEAFWSQDRARGLRLTRHRPAACGESAEGPVLYLDSMGQEVEIPTIQVRYSRYNMDKYFRI